MMEYAIRKHRNHVLNKITHETFQFLIEIQYQNHKFENEHGANSTSLKRNANIKNGTIKFKKYNGIPNHITIFQKTKNYTGSLYPNNKKQKIQLNEKTIDSESFILSFALLLLAISVISPFLGTIVSLPILPTFKFSRALLISLLFFLLIGVIVVLFIGDVT